MESRCQVIDTLIPFCWSNSKLTIKQPPQCVFFETIKSLVEKSSAFLFHLDRATGKALTPFLPRQPIVQTTAEATRLEVLWLLTQLLTIIPPPLLLTMAMASLLHSSLV